MRTTALAAATATILTLVPLAGAENTIMDLAPKETMFVVSADWSRIKTGLDEMGMMELWNEPDVQEFYRQMIDAELDDEMGELTRWFEELDIDPETFPQPEGSAGLAMFVGEPDDELGMMGAPTHTLIHIAYGDNADEFEEYLERMIEQLEDENEFEIDQETYGNTAIHVITVVDDEDDEDADDEDFWMEVEDDTPWMEEMRIARVGDDFIMASDKQAIEDALDRHDGARIGSLQDNPTLATTLAQHPADPDMFAAFFLSESLRESMSAVFDALLPMFMPGADGGKVGEILGLNDLDSVSVAYHVNADDGIAEQTIGVLMPRKRGLFTLIEESSGAISPPDFIAPDTSSFLQLSVRFNRILPIIGEIIGTLPPEIQGQAGAAFDGMRAIYGPLFETVGPDVYIARSIERPLSANSHHNYTAIKISDPLALSNAIGPIAPMMGMQPRDFQGNPIYEEPMSGMGMGIGFGYLFIGAVGEIENAMRRASQPGEDSLADEERFVQAAAALSDDAVVANYSDTRQILEMAYWQMTNMDKVVKAQMEEMGFLDEEMPDNLVPAWAEHLPDVETILKYVGDTVFELRPTEDGFRGRMLVFHPRNKG